MQKYVINYDTLLIQMSIDFVWVSCCFTIYIEVLLFTNMSCSNRISDKQQPSGLKILPAKLNRLTSSYHHCFHKWWSRLLNLVITQSQGVSQYHNLHKTHTLLKFEKCHWVSCAEIHEFDSGIFLILSLKELILLLIWADPILLYLLLQ